MDAFSEQLKKEELAKRTRILKEFNAARQAFITDVLEGRREAKMETQRVWRWIQLVLVFVPLWFRTKTVIELKGDTTTYYITTDGQFVDKPSTYGFGFWHTALSDSMFNDYVSAKSNEDLQRLTNLFYYGAAKVELKRRTILKIE